MRDYLKYKFLIPLILLFGFCPVIGFPQFAPAAGNPGSTAIHMDSSIFVNWATNCSVIIGQEDISNPQSVLASAGDSSLAIGNPGNGIVSLGDGGQAILTFERPIKNEIGWDFAIFENSFSDNYLELAFVEVSSNGLDYLRFETTSLTQDSIQIDAFGSVDPEKINNLAGKYRVNYGTPFDLEELNLEPGLDIDNITHLKIIDVIGSIDSNYGTIDHLGNLINDPFPTPFPSSGFDLDAVGVIHEQPLKVNNQILIEKISVFNNYIEFSINNISINKINISIIDLTGKIIYNKNIENRAHQSKHKLNIESLSAGIYLFNIHSKSQNFSQKIFLK